MERDMDEIDLKTEFEANYMQYKFENIPGVLWFLHNPKNRESLIVKFLKENIYSRHVFYEKMSVLKMIEIVTVAYNDSVIIYKTDKSNDEVQNLLDKKEQNDKRWELREETKPRTKKEGETIKQWMKQKKEEQRREKNQEKETEITDIITKWEKYDVNLVKEISFYIILYLLNKDGAFEEKKSYCCCE